MIWGNLNFYVCIFFFYLKDGGFIDVDEMVCRWVWTVFGTGLRVIKCIYCGCYYCVRYELRE